MKAYMGYEKDASAEGAVLIFANTAKEAKFVGYPYINDFFETEWIDMRVNWLKDKDFLFTQADAEKLKRNIAHVIDNPESCKGCMMWGYILNEDGYCPDCASERNK